MCKNRATCPYCGSRTREVPNSFYGTGLSVHEWIIVCDNCSSARYKDRGYGPEALAEQLAKKSLWSRLLGRLNLTR
jgi:hypothetical protein